MVTWALSHYNKTYLHIHIIYSGKSENESEVIGVCSIHMWLVLKGKLWITSLILRTIFMYTGLNIIKEGSEWLMGPTVQYNTTQSMKPEKSIHKSLWTKESQGPFHWNVISWTSYKSTSVLGRTVTGYMSAFTGIVSFYSLTPSWMLLPLVPSATLSIRLSASAQPWTKAF